MGHVPVEPLCCQVPTSGAPPSRRPVPSWPVCALYASDPVPTMSMSSWR